MREVEKIRGAASEGFPSCQGNAASRKSAVYLRAEALCHPAEGLAAERTQCVAVAAKYPMIRSFWTILARSVEEAFFFNCGIYFYVYAHKCRMESLW